MRPFKSSRCLQLSALAVCLAAGALRCQGQVTFPTQQGGEGATTNVFSPVTFTGFLLVNYDFFSVPDTMDVYYGGAHIFSSGYVSGAGQFAIPYGPALFPNLSIVMNQGDAANIGTLWTYTPTFSPVPEPGWLSLLGVGALAVALARRRARRGVSASPQGRGPG
jgi:hypothetical protein